jgi:hypothetical protein
MRRKNNVPKEGREYNSGNTTAVERAVVADVSPVGTIPAHSHGDEGCEPEDHSDELDSANCELVRCRWEARWCEEEVCDSEERPNRAEQHEVDAMRRPIVAGWAIVGIDDCAILALQYNTSRQGMRHTVRSQTQHNNRKHNLHATKAKDDDGSHHIFGRRYYARRLWLNVYAGVREGCRVEVDIFFATEVSMKNLKVAGEQRTSRC